MLWMHHVVDCMLLCERASDRARHFCNDVMMRRASPCVSGRTTAERPYRSELWRWWCTGTWDAWVGWCGVAGGERERNVRAASERTLLPLERHILLDKCQEVMCFYVGPRSLSLFTMSLHTHTRTFCILCLHFSHSFLLLFLFDLCDQWLSKQNTKHVCFNLKLGNESDCLLECKHHTVQYKYFGNAHTHSYVYWNSTDRSAYTSVVRYMSVPIHSCRYARVTVLTRKYIHHYHCTLSGYFTNQYTLCALHSCTHMCVCVCMRDWLALCLHYDIWIIILFHDLWPRQDCTL